MNVPFLCIDIKATKCSIFRHNSKSAVIRGGCGVDEKFMRWRGADEALISSLSTSNGFFGI